MRFIKKLVIVEWILVFCFSIYIANGFIMPPDLRNDVKEITKNFNKDLIKNVPIGYNAITLNPNWLGVHYTNTKIVIGKYGDKYTIYHELGHEVMLELYFNNTNLLEEFYTLNRKYEKGNRITWYANTNTQEHFAEVFTYYYMFPNSLKVKGNDLFEFMEKVNKMIERK